MLAMVWGFASGAASFGHAAMRQDKLAEIDQAIHATIDAGEIPGACLWIESRGQVYKKAYGLRMVEPQKEKMTLDTIFDMASLTKVLATAPSILHLFERGKVHIDAPVSRYLPEFLDGGIVDEPRDDKVTPEDRERVTVLHLLTHQSGLPPSIFLSKKDFWGQEEGVKRALAIGLSERPGTHFRYSDVNYILLAEIVRRVSGQRIDSYAQDNLYAPLGMRDTGYLPPVFLESRIAPTTLIKDYGLIRGQVHDPTARRMQGVAGNAGIFSSISDVATFVRMFLKKGSLDGVTIFSPETVELATHSQTPQAIGAARGLGWDIDSAYSYQRGYAFPAGTGYGHTGWTGTSIWVDPKSETFVILLSNRNHPNESGRIKQLRIKVGTLAGEAVGYKTIPPRPGKRSENNTTEGRPTFRPDTRTAAAPPEGSGAPAAVVLNGVDVLERDHFSEIAGLRIGLITNQTGVNRQRRSTIDLLAGASNVKLLALFSPEHGIRGTVEYENSVSDDRDAATGLPVYSLYKSSSRKPSQAQMSSLDALVFDIQDIGCRYYTYISTMGLAMEAAAEAGKKFIVLDRVNPIGGVLVDGPVRSGDGNNFVAFHNIPILHGMTAGELARMFNQERHIHCGLTVIPVKGWRRSMRFDETGLPWINPSPNIRGLTEATLYPGIGFLEFTNISVGRGTATPFEQVGAPWINEGRLAGALQNESLPGVSVIPTRFTPKASIYEGEDCGGVRFIITDRNEFRPINLGLALTRILYQYYPKTFNVKERGNILLRDAETLKKIIKGKSNQEIRGAWKKGLDKFRARRAKFLIYQ